MPKKAPGKPFTKKVPKKAPGKPITNFVRVNHLGLRIQNFYFSKVYNNVDKSS